jgi:hypothetical protein
LRCNIKIFVDVASFEVTAEQHNAVSRPVMKPVKSQRQAAEMVCWLT